MFSAGHEPVAEYLQHELFIITFVILSYIAGESVDHIRRVTIPVPYRFQRLLFAETGDREMLGRLDRIHIRLENTIIIGRFLPGVSKPVTIMDNMGYNIIQELENDIPQFESLDDREIFLIFTRIINNSIGTSTKRYRSIYIFVMNMQISSALSGIFAALGLLLNITADPLIPVIAIIVGPMIMFYTIFMFKKIDEEYIDNLLLDYLSYKGKLEKDSETLYELP